VYRLALWRDTLHVAASSPGLGYGFGTFADALPRFKKGAATLQIEHAENDYLQLVAEGGLVAAAAVALAGWMAVRHLAHLRYDDSRARLTREVVGATAAVAAVLCHSAFDFNLRLGAPAALAALSVAVLASAWPRPARRTPLPRAAVALVILLCSALSLLGSGPRRPRTNLGPGSPVRARLEAEAGVAYLRSRPADASTWVQLAWLRYTQSRVEEALALVNHARRLDPGRSDLQEYARRMSRSAGRAADLP
jgi:hypothetical protein